MIAAESPGGRETPKQPGSNGLGEDWDPRDPVFRGINLVSVPWLYGCIRFGQYYFSLD